MTSKKAVLFCATKAIHFHSFHLPYFKWFKDKGYEVHTVSGDFLPLPFVDSHHTIPIQRSPFSTQNIKALLQLKKIIYSNHYEIIHCHTPMGGILTRIAADSARKTGTKVIYTAHGFHFYKGAPIQNWLIYYPIEKWLSSMTDCLITINQEDYKRARERRFKARKIEHVHGVGIDTNHYKPATASQKASLRMKFGYAQDDYILFYAAEFNKNKNQQLLIRTLSLLKNSLPKARLIFAGEGPLLDKCKQLALQLGVQEKIHFAGFRNDIDVLLKLSDVAVASSLREGLPVNVLEAMASGLPIIATNNRGHRELIKNNKNGFIPVANEPSLFASKILSLYNNPDIEAKLGETSLLLAQNYTLSKVKNEMADIYSRYISEEDYGTKSKYYSANL